MLGVCPGSKELYAIRRSHDAAQLPQGICGYFSRAATRNVGSTCQAAVAKSGLLDFDEERRRSLLVNVVGNLYDDG